MKVSKEKRDETRRALLNAAVELFVEKGFTETSIREIAARAQVAPGTAYKYFPDREQLVRAYFELTLADAETQLEQIDNFASFTFKEKLHALLEALLEEYADDREFVALAVRNVVDAPLQSLGTLQPVRTRLLEILDSILNEAVERGEFTAPLHRAFVTNAFWDYTILVILYWVNDHSEAFVQSTEFIDKSLDVYVTLVRSGFIDQMVRLGVFLVKNHLHANMELIASLLGAMSALKTTPRGGQP